uniref:Allene oxide synthase 2 n=1 Tax=Elaeis guineensis var. tenera TaxID=51953 RepID=A0A6I9QUZ9_ELAGV|nr:allene oxide synthase 2 [Elaeis guineensis]
MATKILPAVETTKPVEGGAASKLPIKSIPGSYGIPFISPIKDRLEFYYTKGQDGYFQSRVDEYESTVVRLNVPPGPFMASSPKVVAVLDANSFQVLFDVSKVEKKNVFTGTYMPSTALTGGFRVCSYLDPSEPTHAKVKQLLFNLLASRKSQVIPTFRTNFATLFETMEAQIDADGKADFNKLNDNTSFECIGEVYFGVRPSASNLGTTGPTKAVKWLLFQLAPLTSLGLPKILEEIFLHTFPLPPCLAKSDYKALYKYFSTAAEPVLDAAVTLGLSREEACHNLLFATVFNSYGGMKVMFPGILRWLAKADSDLHAQLAKEIRSAVAAEGGKVTLAAVEKMELMKSVVYEALRMDPPVKFQYGKAKKDLIIESHDAAYEVKKGEMLFGYQPLATRDERVFANAGEFVADRFVGEKGKKLLKYVVWSNGPETESPSLSNKQCAGKELVVLLGRLLLVELFLRYDTFTAEVGTDALGIQVTFTSLTKPSATS